LKISVVIPFYNEENQIPETINGLLPILNSLEYDYELILVDDGSTDNTWSMLEKASKYKRPDSENGFSGIIKAICFSRNFGKEAAISAGLHESCGEAVITMDGDLQHPPKYIPIMINMWKSGHADVVEGVKQNRKNDSYAQRINAFIFYKIFAKASGYNLMNASDFKLLDKQVVDQWKRLGEHDTFFRALSVWLGYRRQTFEFDVPPRKKGSGKWPLIRLAKLSINAITSFSALPLYFITVMGCFSLFVSIVLGLQTIIKWFSGTSATGFTTVILLELSIGGLIMISLGLIGIYIARIFTEVKGRPSYIISKTTLDYRDF